MGNCKSIRFRIGFIKQPISRIQVLELSDLARYRKRIGNYQILILDEWLNYKLSEKDAKNLYELFEQRSGNHSTVFVGQYPVDEWHGRLGGGTQADSIMDRIIHNAYEIPANETNLRKLVDEIES